MNYTYIRYNREDAYFNGFLNNMTLRPSCVECDFKGTKRVADITLADFWGIGKVCPAFPRQEGVSMVMINSLKGKKLWDAVACEDVCSQEVCKERVVGKVNSAIWKSVSEHSKRREFFGSYGMMDIEKALTYYCVPAKVPFIKKVLRKLKRMLT